MTEYSTDTLLAFSRGFDHGNYGNAYESTDFGTWKETDRIPVEFADPAILWAFEAGRLLGFFSGYEDHEISGEWVDHVVEVRRQPSVVAVASQAGVAID